jgi:DNA integrity scanning protein DisA with diadenylate cyclase activity
MGVEPARGFDGFAAAFGMILWLRRARARRALLGLIAVVPVYLLAAALEFQVTLRILQGFLAMLVIVLVVVFQEDLRRFFERIGTWGMGDRPALPCFDAVDALVRTAGRLADTRTRALIVIPGRDALDRHLDRRVELQARLSEPLLRSPEVGLAPPPGR